MDLFTLGREPLPKKTRKEVFLDEMNQVVPGQPWSPSLPRLPVARTRPLAAAHRFPSRPCCAYTACNWNPSNPAMEEKLHERPLYRRFAGLDRTARTCWRSTSWPRGCWPPSIPDWPKA